jgi:hypothetical protein
VSVFCGLAAALIAATGAEPLASAQPGAGPAPDTPATQPPSPAQSAQAPASQGASLEAPTPAPPVAQAPVEEPAEQTVEPTAAPVAELSSPPEQRTLATPPGDEKSGAWTPPGQSDHASDNRGQGQGNGWGNNGNAGGPSDWNHGPPAGEEPEAPDQTEPGQGLGPPDNRGRRAWGRDPNLTGAVGIAGGGGKEAGRVGRSALSSPRPPTATPSPEPPLDEAPSQGGSEGTPPGSQPPSSGPPTRGGGGGPLNEGAPKNRPRRAGFQIPAGTGAGGGTRATTVPTGTPGTTATTATGGGTGTPAATVPLPAPAVSADFSEPVGESEGGGNGSANPGDEIVRRGGGGDEDQLSIIRPVEKFVDKVPDSLKFALAALGVLSLLLGLAYLVTALRARSLARQRSDLLQEVGLLQSALLPPVPEKLGALRTSVAYRPADGPGAGGDFYDVLPLVGGSVGFILGDVSGHGRGALARTAFMRYTLRAYLEAGLEPRVALQVAGRVIDENLGGDFATVLLAVHNPETGSLTYATAGHPAPIVIGPQPHDPVTAGSSPPIGVGVPTGLRQTTVPLVPGSVACLFTDGLMEARAAGGILGRDRLEQMLGELGDNPTARGLIERVSQEARVLSDDIAAVVVSPTEALSTIAPHTEQLELSARELDGPIAHRFLEGCGIAKAAAATAVAEAHAVAGRAGGVVLHVMCGDEPTVEVRPRDFEGIETASRRTGAR